MSLIIHVGKHRIQTVTASDGSTIPLGALTATSDNPNLATASVDPATNAVTVTAINPSTPSANVTYSAPGYGSVVQQINVLPVPTLIVTDGPEQ